MIIAATGHRPDKLGGYGPAADQRRRDLAFHWLREQAPERVISGMALGWDTAVAEAAYNLGIPFTAAVPFEGQELRWPEHSQRVYRALLAAAADIVVISPNGFNEASMQLRNVWMVDHCDRLGALWDGSSGGTANCIRYAKRTGRDIVNLWPQWSALTTN